MNAVQQKNAQSARVVSLDGKPKMPFIPKFQNLPNVVATILPNGWAVAVVAVGPDLATEMLSRNWKNQREPKRLQIEKMAWDMLNEKWLLTHQGIAFDESGTLYDGQNRLMSIIASGCTVELMVFFGVGRLTEGQEAEVIDTHKVRDQYDAARIGGIDATKRHAAILNAAIRYGAKNGYTIVSHMTNSLRLDILEKWLPLLRKVDDWIGHAGISRKVMKGPIAAAVFCAAQYLPHDRLERFVLVSTDQAECNPGEGAAKLLRQYALTASGKFRHGAEPFLKACRAIQLFLEGKEVRTLVACSENPYQAKDLPALSDITLPSKK